MAGATVSETIQPNGAGPEGQGGRGIVTADLTREYAAGGNGYQLPAFLRNLPLYIDDVTADFALDLYERMLFDPRIAAESDNLRAAILEDGLILSPAVEDKDADGYALAKTIFEAAGPMLDDLDTSLDDVLWDLASGMLRGNRIAEQVYDYGDIGGQTKLLLTGLHVKPRESVRLVVDAYNNIVGLLPQLPGQYGIPSVVALDPANPPDNLLPRHKFAIYSNKPRDNDPRGTSILRPAYLPWVQKIEIVREYIKYLARFASPAIVGILPPGARDQAVLDPATKQPTGEVIRATDAFLATLLDFHNGSALAVAHGTEIKDLYSQGDGSAFLNAIAACNLDIALAISGQSLASNEGEHNARAAAQVHQDTRNTRVKQFKKGFSRVIRRDVLMEWVRANWGDLAAAKLTPLAGLGSIEEEDKTGQWNAAAALNRASYLAPSQKIALDKMIGLPERSPEDVAADQERASQPPPDPVAPAPPGQQPQGDRGDEQDKEAA